MSDREKSSVQNKIAVEEAISGHLFVSYSRKDIETVTRLVDRLKDRGRDVWVDLEGIPPVGDWLEEIRTAIARADACLFILSPSFANSTECRREVEYAVSLGKRLIPILIEDVHSEGAAHTVHPELARLNWILMRTVDDWDEAAAMLQAGIDADLDWVGEHTRVLIKAREWEGANREASLLAHGHDLKVLEAWLKQGPTKDPKPSALQTEFVLASRVDETARSRRRIAAIGTALIVVISVSVVAFLQSNERARQEELAAARQLTYQSEVWREFPPDRLDRALRSGVEALEVFRTLEVPSVDADTATRSSLALTPARQRTYEMDLHRDLDVVTVNPAGTFVAAAAGGDNGELLVWGTQSERIVARVELGVSDRPTAAVTSADGKFAAVVFQATGGDNHFLTLWDLRDGTLTKRIALTGYQDRVSLSPEGRIVAVGRTRPMIIDVPTDNELTPNLVDGLIRDIAFSSDGERMALVYRPRDTRDSVIRISDLSGNNISEQAYTQRLESVQWTSDSPRLLAFGRQETLFIDGTSGKQIGRFPAGGDAFAVQPSGELLTAEVQDSVVRIRTSQSGDELLRFSVTGGVRSLGFRPDDQAIVTATNTHIRITETDGSGAVAAIGGTGATSSITDIAWALNNDILLSRDAIAITAWRPDIARRGGLEQVEVSAGSHSINEPYEFQLTADTDRTARKGNMVVEVASTDGGPGRQIRIKGMVSQPAWSDDGRWFGALIGRSTRGGFESRLELYDLASDGAVLTVELPGFFDDREARFLSVTPDGQYLVTGRDSQFEFWNMATGQVESTLVQSSPTAMSFDSTGERMAALSADRRTSVWDRTQGIEIARIEHSEAIVDIALSPSGRWLATLAKSGASQLWAIDAADLILQACSRLRSPCP